jgi:DNA-binding NarL/FixJ family response regulator
MNPQARFLFVTNESSAHVIDEAFSRGAFGYVYKPHAGRDLLPAIDAVLEGQFFVSSGLQRPGRLRRPDARHDVLFYSSDAVFVSAFSRFIVEA